MIEESEWRKLYAAAEDFRRLAPWKWMDDDQLFAVKSPETGTMYYCTVLGALGEVFALVAYEGDEGFYGYLKLLSGEIPEGPRIEEYQKVLMASFDDRRYLHPEDLAVIRSLGLKFRGKNGWPMFRHYLPGYYPWFLDAGQVRMLTLCLEQALDVVPRCLDNPGLLPPPGSGILFVRELEIRDGQGFWRDRILPAPPPSPPPKPPHIPLNEVGMARIRRQGKKKSGIWEIGYCFAPMPIHEKSGERPYFPRLLGVVDHKSGLVLTFHLEKQGEHWRAFRDILLSCLETQTVLPEKFLIDHDEAEELIRPIVKGLGIVLQRAKKLPAFAEAIEGLRNSLLK